MTVIRNYEVTTGDGAHLRVQSFGEPGDPAVILIGGMTWSMDYWDAGLCELLARRSRRVIRYDARDTGESTTYPAGRPGYTGDEMVTDVIAILDHLGLSRAHVVGLSMGGAIAQSLALEFRSRVGSLALLSTSPIERPDFDLPAPEPELAASFTGEGPTLDFSDRVAVVDWLVANERLYVGRGEFDETAARELAERVVDRTGDIRANQLNQAVVPPGSMGAAPLAELAGLPVLVVHGEVDPLFPPAHARALVGAIPGARLLLLEGVGHQLPSRRWWGRLIDELVALSVGA